MGDYSWACFASQQSAEKAVKAFYDYLGGEGWGHMVVKLLKQLPEDEITVEKELLDIAVYLDKMYIPTRYPSGFETGAPADYYTEKEAKEAILYAEDILSFIEAKIR